MAPSEASMPSARSRRWAMTVKPATASSPTNNNPTVPSTSTMTSAPVRLAPPRELDADPAPLCRLKDCRDALAGVHEDRDVGRPALAWPGATSANSSSRFTGFSTIPTTCRDRPSTCQTPPESADRTTRPRRSSPRPGRDRSGTARESRRSVARPYPPAGLSDRRSTVDTEPGTDDALVLDHVGSVPNRLCTAAMSAARWGSAPDMEMMVLAVPNVGSAPGPRR